MTATLALPPVYAAAVVNGLVGVAVLDAVPCPACHGAGPRRLTTSLGGTNARNEVTFTLTQHICSTCDGSGTVAPPVEPGQRINLAAVGDVSLDWNDAQPDDSPLDLCRSADGERWELAVRDDSIEHGFEPGAWVSENTTYYPLHTRKVVGSAVAASTALPIVDGHKATHHLGPMIAVLDGGRLLMMDPGLSGYEDTTTVTDLTAALPWLPSDLVGRWAVLLEGAATTEQRCPTCWGETHWSRCDTCVDNWTCPPVPLPDGFDPEPYTLTELEMTT